jgi:Zn-dependent M16 (insulinase) family peptidase
VVNSDENKTFGAVFRTPVSDSTGIPHILEHSVLCGSRKYPIKEPFVELMKGSLNTFLNAFTYPDRTCYPVASTNAQVGPPRCRICHAVGTYWFEAQEEPDV